MSIISDSDLPTTADALADKTPPAKTVALSSKKAAPYVKGRRPFMRYRDMGVATASNGEMRAVMMQAVPGMVTATDWHRHSCQVQFLFIQVGWLKIQFGDGSSVQLDAGDSLMIPGGTVHREVGYAEDLELLEVSVPADMGTESVPSPIA